jgi:hypothetical protein
LCIDRLYRAGIDLIAIGEGGEQISLTVVALSVPEGSSVDSNSYPGMCLVEFMPDANTPPQVEFKFRITFDPNMCVDPNAVTMTWNYLIKDTIPAPVVPVIEFEVVE